VAADLVEAARSLGGHLLVLSRTKLSHYLLSSLIGIYRETVAPIQQYPNICWTKRPLERKEEENPHASQKREGLRHPKIESTQKPGLPATTSLKCKRTGKSACPTKTLPDDDLLAGSILNDGPANPLRSI